MALRFFQVGGGYKIIYMYIMLPWEKVLERRQQGNDFGKVPDKGLIGQKIHCTVYNISDRWKPWRAGDGGEGRDCELEDT